MRVTPAPVAFLLILLAGVAAGRAQAPEVPAPAGPSSGAGAAAQASATAATPAAADAPASVQAAVDAASAPADPFRFSTDAGMMMWTVKADRTEDFESVWGVIRSRLSDSGNPALRELGAGLRFYRVRVPASPDVTYLFLASPASKTTSYSASPYLLYESGLFERPEAEELFKLLQGALVSVTAFPLNQVP